MLTPAPRASLGQDGYTPLHRAACGGLQIGGFVDCVELLIDAGADMASKNAARHCSCTPACARMRRACSPLYA